MTNPSQLATECLELCNEATGSLAEAREDAQNATNEASEAEDKACEARQSADSADDQCINCENSLEDLRAKLEDLSNQLEDPQDKLSADMARHKQAVKERVKAGRSPQKIASNLDISVVLVDLIIAQIEREAVSAS